MRQLTARIFFKLLGSFSVLLLLALIVADIFVSRTAEATLIETRVRELTQKGRAFRRVFSHQLLELRDADLVPVARDAGVRLTVIALDGRVLADSEHAAASMENHANRPEVKAALEYGEGHSSRVSPTLGTRMLYYAVRLPDGILRLSVPLQDLERQVGALRREILASISLALVPAMLLAAVFARRVSHRVSQIIDHAGRLAQGDFHHRLNWEGKGELRLLAQKLDETASKLEALFNQLREEHEELKRLERVRKDFVINVSHELRTPVAAIQGYVEALLDGALADPQNNVRFLEIIRHNAQRLANLVNDLLTLSRIELNQREFQFAWYDVNELVRQTVESFRPAAESKDLELRLELAQGPLEAYCDESAVGQALNNLIDNAIKYTPEGGTVTVRVQPVTDQDEGVPKFVEVTVSDTGPGIPEEDQPRIFERFYRVDKARSRALGGTGLGLSIVKHLVQAQGGQVWVRSRLGEGSTFGFTLPADVSCGRPAADVESPLTKS